jgi:hypothetical protein
MKIRFNQSSGEGESINRRARENQFKKGESDEIHLLLRGRMTMMIRITAIRRR